MLLFVLASMENTGTKPTQGLLAYSVGTAVPTVSKLMNELQDEGWIEIINPKNKRLKETNLYTINWDKIKEYATDKDYFIPTAFQKDGTENGVEETSVEEVVEVKTPFIQIKQYEKDLEEYTNILLEMVKGGITQEQYDKYKAIYVKKLANDYNKSYDDIMNSIRQILTVKSKKAS